MDNSNNTAVVHSFTEKRKTTQAHVDLDGARRLLSMPTFSWSMAVQQILMVAGLDVSEALLVDEPPATLTSSAYQLGHKNLKSLITSAESEDGLGMSWDEFREKLTAAVYKKKYQISENDFREINALVSDATDILGRAPIDIGEFHATKEKALTERINTMSREHDARVRDLTERQQVLVRDLTKRQQELDGVRSDNERLSQEVVQRINEMRRETAESQDRIERQADLRVAQEIERIGRERDVALQQQREEISAEVHQITELRNAAENALSDIKAQIASGVYVEASVVRGLEDRLHKVNLAEVELNNQLLSLNEQLIKEQQESLALRNKLESLTLATEGDKEQIRALEQRLRDIIEERLDGSTEFMILQERLSISRTERAVLEQSNVQLQDTNLMLERKLSEVRGAHENLKVQGREYCNHLRSINAEATEANKSLVKQLGQAKLTLGVVLVSGVGAAIALTLSMTGLI